MVLVLLDQRIGGPHDHLGAAVVLLQFEELVVRVVAAEVEDVLDVGPAEGVDALAVIAHHGDVLMPRRQGLHDAVLHGVRVLVLVHQQVLEALLVFQHGLRVVSEEQGGIVQQVIEVHGSRAETLLRIGLVQIADALTAHAGVARHQFHIGQVFQRTDEVVLRDADAAVHLVGLVQLVVQLPLLHDALDHAAAVVGIVDREVLGVAQLVGLRAQDAAEHAVEGAHPQVGGLAAAHHRGDARLHLLGRLVGEGQGQDPEGVHLLAGHQVRNAHGKHLGLAATRPGDHHRGAIGMLHCRTLCGVQALQIIHGKGAKVTGRGEELIRVISTAQDVAMVLTRLLTSGPS